MTKSELETEITETRLTIQHLVRIGEVGTAKIIVKYLDELLAARRKLPILTIVR